MFIEHFARRLLVAHGKAETFTCAANLATEQFMKAVRDTIGKDGGRLPGSLSHGCQDCTHGKRFRADLLNEGILLGNGHGAAQGVAELPEDGLEHQAEQVPQAGVPAAPAPPQQAAPANNADRGVVRMAVMDGKTITHRVRCDVAESLHKLN